MVIDDRKKVRVQYDGRDWDLELTGEKSRDEWKVVLPSGARLGRVFKTSYDYSPPIHKGSRIARYHHKVQSWKGEIGDAPFDSLATIHERTRKAALIDMLRMQIERWDLRSLFREFVNSHPDAQYRMQYEGTRMSGYPVFLSAHMALRSQSAADVRIPFRSLERENVRSLEVSLTPHKGFDAIVNVIHEWKESQ